MCKTTSQRELFKEHSQILLLHSDFVFKKYIYVLPRISLVVQWLRLQASTAWGLIPGLGTKIPHAQEKNLGYYPKKASDSKIYKIFSIPNTNTKEITFNKVTSLRAIVCQLKKTWQKKKKYIHEHSLAIKRDSTLTRRGLLGTLVYAGFSVFQVLSSDHSGDSESL